MIRGLQIAVLFCLLFYASIASAETYKSKEYNVRRLAITALNVDFCTQVHESMLMKRMYAKSEDITGDKDKNYGVLIEGIDLETRSSSIIFIAGQQNFCKDFIAKKVSIAVLRLNCNAQKHFICPLSGGYYANQFLLEK